MVDASTRSTRDAATGWNDFNLIDDLIDARLQPQLSFPAITFGGRADNAGQDSRTILNLDVHARRRDTRERRIWKGWPGGLRNRLSRESILES